MTVILNRKRGKKVDSKRVSLHLTTTRRDIMGIHKFCRIANRSVTGTCKNCLCFTSPASSWLHISSEIGLAWCFSLKKLQQGFFSGKSSCCCFSGADICRICVELCALGLRASHLVKMLPFLRWLISDMEPSRILVLTRVMAILLKRQPSWPEVKWWISESWISLLFSNS